MLLRESGKKSNQQLNLNVVTGAEGEAGVEHERELLAVAEAVVGSDPSVLADMREQVLPVLGAQGLADAITVAAGFNGITKIANATGLPLDLPTVHKTEAMRRETGIDDYSETHKAALFDRV
jgi:hypothetical protein